jgi:hypothetical protein
LSKVFVTVGGLFVMAAMSFVLIEYAVGSIGGFDRMLFSGKADLLSMGHPGRPSVQSAVSFIALIFVTLGDMRQNDKAGGGLWREGLVFISASIAVLALFGYAFSATALFLTPALKGVGLSPYAAILFLCSALALIITQADSPLAKIFKASGPSGFLVRWLCPIFIVVPLFLGLLRGECERLGWISHETGIALMAYVQFLIGMAMLIWVARTLSHVEALKRQVKISCFSKLILDKGSWVTVEKYLSDNYNVEISHGMTPDEADIWLRQGTEEIVNADGDAAD